LSGVAETWWDAGGIFACPDTDSFSARCQNQEEHSLLAVHTAEFLHVLVLLAAGLALCYGESNNLTCNDSSGDSAPTARAAPAMEVEMVVMVDMGRVTSRAAVRGALPAVNPFARMANAS
jgi:hypothetical protein